MEQIEPVLSSHSSELQDAPKETPECGDPWAQSPVDSPQDKRMNDAVADANYKTLPEKVAKSKKLSSRIGRFFRWLVGESNPPAEGNAVRGVAGALHGHWVPAPPAAPEVAAGSDSPEGSSGVAPSASAVAASSKEQKPSFFRRFFRGIASFFRRKRPDLIKAVAADSVLPAQEGDVSLVSDVPQEVAAVPTSSVAAASASAARLPQNEEIIELLPKVLGALLSIIDRGRSDKDILVRLEQLKQKCCVRCITCILFNACLAQSPSMGGFYEEHYGRYSFPVILGLIDPTRSSNIDVDTAFDSIGGGNKIKLFGTLSKIIDKANRGEDKIRIHEGAFINDPTLSLAAAAPIPAPNVSPLSAETASSRSHSSSVSSYSSYSSASNRAPSPKPESGLEEEEVMPSATAAPSAPAQGPKPYSWEEIESMADRLYRWANDNYKDRNEDEEDFVTWLEQIGGGGRDFVPLAKQEAFIKFCQKLISLGAL